MRIYSRSRLGIGVVVICLGAAYLVWALTGSDASWWQWLLGIDWTFVGLSYVRDAFSATTPPYKPWWAKADWNRAPSAEPETLTPEYDEDAWRKARQERNS